MSADTDKEGLGFGLGYLSGCHTDEEKIFRFHYQTMRLFSKMCAGRNRTVTDFLLTNVETFGVKYTDLIAMLKNPQLPHCYRAVVGELIIALYVDREPYEVIAPLNFVWVWSETSAVVPVVQPQWKKMNPYSKFPQLQPEPGFSALKEALHTLISSIGSFGAMSIEESYFSDVCNHRCCVEGD